MGRLIAGILLGVTLTILAGTPIRAADCEFRLGFKTLRDLIGHDIVGECLENEHYNAIGDSNQQTTGGLMAWRKTDNWTAFTDGYRTWINGPNGLVQRLNTERFPWEADHIPVTSPTPGPAPSPPPAPTPIPPPTIDPSLAHVFQVMRSTRTGREIADKFLQMGASAVFGDTGGFTSRWESSPRRITINQEHRSESPEALAFALIWPTMAMSVWVEEGNSTSWKECMNRVVAVERLQAQWWLEKFGTNGKQNPTQLEQWANYDLDWLRTQNSRNVWMSTHYREQCEGDDPGPVIDPDLAIAFVTALKGESEIGRAAVDAVVEAGTEVVFGRVGGWGSYSPSHNVITISEELKGYSNQVLALVLVHEAFHVLSHGMRGGQRQATAAECLQEEVNAFRLSALWWYEWYGRNGKSSPNRVERSMNNLMWELANQRLREWVLLSEGYQYQCLGGVVN